MKSRLSLLLAAVALPMLMSLPGCVLAERDSAYYRPIHQDRYYGYYGEPRMYPGPRQDIVVVPDHHERIYGRD